METHQSRITGFILISILEINRPIGRWRFLVRESNFCFVQLEKRLSVMVPVSMSVFVPLIDECGYIGAITLLKVYGSIVRMWRCGCR